MSQTQLGRALEFMQQPQDVEVHRNGHWVLGSMIGWRQEEGSSCRVMVRVTEQGAEKTAWAELHDVRLAERPSYPPTESLPFIPHLPEGLPTQRDPGTGRHHAPARPAWWPTSDEPGSQADDVAPTRLLPVPAPHLTTYVVA